MTATVASLQEEYAPLTEAEAEQVLRELGDRDVADVVAEVKAQRVGPAAKWDDTPDPESVVVPEVESLREQLDQAAQRRIDAAGNNSDRALNEAGRLKANLDEISAYLLNDVDEVLSGQAAAETPDVDVEESTAADLVAHLRDHPGDADAIEEAENAREGGPRKSVLAAIDKAREGQS